MKKVLSGIISILLILSMLPVSAIAATGAVQLSVGSATVTENSTDTIAIPISISDNPGIASVGFMVLYDADVFDYVSFSTSGNVFSKTEFTVNGNVDGQVMVSPYCADNKTGNGELLTLNFVLNAGVVPGNYSVDIDITSNESLYGAYDQNGEFVDANVTNGSITVTEKPKADFTEDMYLATDKTSYTYGDTVNVSVANLADGADVKYIVNDGEPADTVNIKDAGEYTISAVVSKDGYNDLELDPIKVTIAKKGVTISGITATDKTYDGTTTVEVNTDDAKINGVIAEDDVDANFPAVVLPAADAGSYTLDFDSTVLTGKDAKNYEITDIEEVTVTVSPIDVTVEIDDVTKKVGVALPDPLPYTVDPEKPFVGDTILVGKPAVETGWTDEAGKEYTITKGTLAIKPAEQAKNYNITFEEGKLTITEANLEKIQVTVDDSFQDTYYEGDTFLADGLTITAYYDNGTTATVAANLCKITPSVMPTVEEDGTKKDVTIDYNGKTATVEVTINKDDITAIEAVIADANKVVWVGDEVVVKSVTATYESGKTADLASSLYRVDCDTSAENVAATVTVSLIANAKISNAEQTVTVIKQKLSGLEVVEDTEGALSKVAGQTFKVSDGGVKINALYVDKAGTVTKVDVTSQYSTVTVTSDKAGTVTETLEYADEAFGAYKPAPVKADLKVVFAAKVVTSVEVVTDPTKTEYIEGTDFDPAGVQIKVTYNDGEEITADADDYAGYGISFDHGVLELGDKTVTVACGGKTDTITVEVNPRTLTGIEVTVNKDEYIDGESFDKADIAVKAKYDNGDVETVTDYTVDADTFVLAVANEAETQTVTVTYGSQTHAYTVDVVPCAAINETTGKRYASIDEAFEDAEEGDEISIEIAADDVDVDVEVEVTITNNTGDEITITVNDEEITIADDESHTVEIEEEDAIGDYYFFYMQMLQWRNRMFKISYKQTEGGEISGSASVRNGETAEITVTPDEGYAIADVLVNGKSVGAVESYKIRNIKSNQTVSAVFEKIAATSPFVDVSVDAPYFDAVLYVYNNGIINGVSETEMVFAPDTTMTRAMFVTVLGRMSGVNMADYPVVTFADCEAGSWYAPYVEWAAQAGIVKGYSAETFGPMDEITVEQAAVILYRYIAYMGYNTAADADLANYADGAQVSEWAAEQMKWALANNIYVSDTTLDPQAPAVRSLVAEMLYNLSVWMG